MATTKEKKEKLAKIARIRANIQYLRKSVPWSQYEMAEKLKISRATINGWENENAVAIPKPDSLSPVAKHFKISVDDILTLDLSKEMPKSTPEVKQTQEQLIEALQYTVDLQKKYIALMESTGKKVPG